MKKKFQNLFVWFLIALIFCPEVIRAYEMIDKFYDDVKLKSVYGTDNITYENIQYSEVESPKKEAILRSPTILETADNKTVGYEILSKRSENSKSYITNDDAIITEIFLEPIHTLVDGLYIEMDNSLENIGDVIQNKLGNYNVTFYKNNEMLYSVENENSKEIGFLFSNSDLSRSSYLENRIYYTDIQTNIDLEYIINNSFLKENIIFNQNQTSNKFIYQIKTNGMKIKKQSDLLCIYENKDCEFEIVAPYMKDKENNLNLNVQIDYQLVENDLYEIILTYDLDWLNDESRVYPVILDPTVVPASQNINVDSSYIRSNYPTQTSRYEHLFVGYDKNGTASGAGASYNLGYTRTFISFDMPNIGENRTIETAILQLDKNTVYNSAMNVIDVYKTETFINPNTVKWNNQPTNLTLISSQDVGTSTGYKSLDITDYIADLNSGNKKTLVLKANIESTSYYPVVFNSEHTGSIPKITIVHRPNNDIDDELDLNTLDGTLRIYSKGYNRFEAVSIDGIAKPGSTVTFKLYQKDENGAKIYLKDFNATNPADRYFINPIYITSPISGVQSYLKDDINYTSDYENKNEFSIYDKAYGYEIVVTNEGNSNTNLYETDEFIIYNIKLGDTLKNISSNFGIPISIILEDNNMEETFIKEDDSLILRVSKNNSKLTPDIYTPKSVISEYYAEFEYLGPNCKYGCVSPDPINIFTGNFFAEMIDIELKDVLDIKLSRTYNSKGEKYSTMFGRGFSFNYDKSVALDKENNILFFQGDGSIIKIPYINGSYVPDVTDYYKVIKTTNEIQITDFATNETFYFNPLGILTKIETNENELITFNYNDFGLLETISLGNKTITFQYNEYNLVSNILLPNATNLSYTYNSNRELIKFTDAAGNSETYSYDNLGRMVSITDRNGNTLAQNTYDSQNRVTTQYDALGKLREFSYSQNKTTLIYDGKVESYEYDHNSRLTNETYGDGSSIKRTYDERNNLIEEKNESGNSKYYTYDNKNNLTKTIDYNGDVTEYFYDTKNNLIKKNYPNLETETYTYDSNNKVISYTNQKNETEYYAYNNNGEKISYTNKFGNIEKYEYQNGNLSKVIQSNSLIIQYYYDSLGNVIKELDSNGKSTQYIYDLNNNLIKEIDSYSNTEEYKYDKNNNKIEYRNKMGGVTTYEYDNNNRLIKETTGNQFKAYDYNMDDQIISEYNELNEYLNYEYDQKGRAIKVIDNLGNIQTKGYDEKNNVIFEKDIYGSATEYKYNEKNQLIEKTIDGVKECYIYDSLNRLTKTLYQNGLFEELTYDYHFNIIKKVDTKGVVYEYAYDNNKNLLKETKITNAETYIVTHTYTNNLKIKSLDSNGIITNYKYDIYGNLKETNKNDGFKESYKYDLYQNVIEIKNQNNNTKKYEYDLLNRLVKETNYDGGIKTTEYNANNQITKTVNENGHSVINVYDSYDKLLSTVNENNHQTRYTYDAYDRLDSTIDAYGVVSSYIYSNENNLYQIVTDNKVTAEYHYDIQRRITREQEFNAITSFSYDKHSNILSKYEMNKGIVTNYTYDIYDNKLSEESNTEENQYFVYNSHNELIKKTDYMNRSIVYTYDELGNILKEESIAGTTFYKYDSYGKKISETKNDVTTTYIYDNQDRVIKTLTNNELVNETMYDDLDRVIKTIDPLGNVTTNTYDYLGNITSTKDKEGHTTKYVYDGLNQTIKTTNALGETLINEYDIYGNIIKTTDTDNTIKQFKYNAFNQLLEELDELNFKTTYYYNENFTLNSIIYPYDYKETYYYDSYGNISKFIQKDNSELEYTYDLRGNIISEKDAKGYKTTYQYNHDNQVIEAKRSDGYTIYYQYDLKNNLIKKYDNYNILETYEYNHLSQKVKSVNSLNVETFYEYDIYGNLNKEITSNQVSVHTYDKNNKLIKTIINDEKIFIYEYDKMGNLTKEIQNNQIIKDYTYNGIYLITSKYEIGNPTINYTYYSNHEIKEMIINNVIIMNYTYDNKGNLLSEESMKGIKHFTYDAFNNQTSITDTNQHTTKYEYDSMNRVVKLKDPENNIVKYHYDKNGNLSSKQIGLTNETYQYDSNNNIIQVMDQYHTITKYTYDIYNNKISETKPDKTSVYYQYDSENNLISKSSGSINIKYYYDSQNNLTIVHEGNKTSQYTYDAYNNITSYVDYLNRTINYHYDIYDNQIGIDYPNHTKIEYTYNLDNQISTVKENNQIIATYEHDKFLNEFKLVRPNGLVTNKEYDKLGRILNIQHYDNQRLLSSFSYTYDGEDNILSETSNKDNQTTLKEYKYNSRNELIEERISGSDNKRINYSYDVLGNKIETIDNDTKYYTYQNNQLVKISEPNKTTNISYDENGNIKTIKENNRTIESYKYDEFDRLIGYEDVKYKVTYAYSGEDYRVEQSVLNKIAEKVEQERINQLSLKDVNELYESLDLESGFETLEYQLNKKTCEGLEINTSSYFNKTTYVVNPTKEYSEVLVSYNNNQSRKEIYAYERIKTNNDYYLNSKNYNVEQIIDSNKQIKKSYNYESYGIEKNNKVGISYNGEEKDASNLIYLRARYYHPKLKIFISKDTYKGTVGNILSQNQYSYTENNPIKYIDKSGESVFIPSGSLGNITKTPAQRISNAKVCEVNNNSSRAHSINPNHVGHYEKREVMEPEFSVTVKDGKATITGNKGNLNITESKINQILKESKCSQPDYALLKRAKEQSMNDMKNTNTKILMVGLLIMGTIAIVVSGTSLVIASIPVVAEKAALIGAYYGKVALTKGAIAITSSTTLTYGATQAAVIGTSAATMSKVFFAGFTGISIYRGIMKYDDFNSMMGNIQTGVLGYATSAMLVYAGNYLTQYNGGLYLSNYENQTPIYKYSVSVQENMKKDPLYHGFPDALNQEILRNPVMTRIDGRIEYLMKGSINGVEGVYHITTKGNQIIHRFFNAATDWERYSGVYNLPSYGDIPFN